MNYNMNNILSANSEVIAKSGRNHNIRFIIHEQVVPTPAKICIIANVQVSLQSLNGRFRR